MAMIKARYRRVVQVRPYETQEIELGVEEEVDVKSGTLDARLAPLAERLYKSLEAAGDQLVADVIGKPDPRDAAPVPAQPAPKPPPRFTSPGARGSR